jgi:DNA-directed RNA polymerase subunit RPC12/RpoP
MAAQQFTCIYCRSQIIIEGIPPGELIKCTACGGMVRVPTTLEPADQSAAPAAPAEPRRYPLTPGLPSEEIIQGVVARKRKVWPTVVSSLIMMLIGLAVVSWYVRQWYLHESYLDEQKRQAQTEDAPQNPDGSEPDVDDPYPVPPLEPIAVAVFLFVIGMAAIVQTNRRKPARVFISDEQFRTAEAALAAICRRADTVRATPRSVALIQPRYNAKFAMCNARDAVIFIATDLRDYFSVKKRDPGYVSAKQRRWTETYMVTLEATDGTLWMARADKEVFQKFVAWNTGQSVDGDIEFPDETGPVVRDEHTYAPFLCPRCGQEILIDKTSSGEMECPWCYEQIAVADLKKKE